MVFQLVFLSVSSRAYLPLAPVCQMLMCHAFCTPSSECLTSPRSDHHTKIIAYGLKDVCHDSLCTDITAVQPVCVLHTNEAVDHPQDNSGRLLKQMAAARDDLDVLFAELDTSLAQSKQIFDQVASSRQAPAVDAAFGSTAALSASSSTHNGLVAAAVAASALQVPAYVHVGNPLVVDEPHGPVSTAETERINWCVPACCSSRKCH